MFYYSKIGILGLVKREKEMKIRKYCLVEILEKLKHLV